MLLKKLGDGLSKMEGKYKCPKDAPCMSEENGHVCTGFAKLDDTSNSYFASTYDSSSNVTLTCPFTNFLDELKSASHENRQVNDLSFFDAEGNMI